MILLVTKAQLVPCQLRHGGLEYRVEVNPLAVRPLEVWRGSRKIAFGLLTRYHPWCLQVADVDGHGQAIAVGVSKPTHNLKFPHRTLFLISFDGHELKRKWTGSSMGRPLLEFCFGRSKPQRLFTLERCLDERVALSGYKWVGFGFRKTGPERFWHSAAELRPKASGLSLTADRHQVLLPWSDL